MSGCGVRRRVAGLDVHKETVVATVRVMVGRKAERECRTFETTTAGLSALLAWLTETRCSHVAMEATGVYWKPVWHILADGNFQLILANAAHVKNVPGPQDDNHQPRAPEWSAGLNKIRDRPQWVFQRAFASAPDCLR